MVDVLLVGADPELLVVFRSTLERPGIVVVHAPDHAAAKVLSSSLACAVVVLASHEDGRACSTEQLAPWASNARVVAVSRRGHAARPPASTTDAWFSSPPTRTEVVDFIERFFGPRERT